MRSRRARAVLAAASASAALAAIALACFTELPPPLDAADGSAADAPDVGVDAGICPSVAESSCATASPLGCPFPVPDLPDCLRAPEKTCSCGADECPALSPNPCYANGGTCPDAVLTEFPDAVCLTFPAPQFPPDTCVCGCATCLSTCDGRGPLVFAARDGGLGQSPMLAFAVPDLPSSGALGVYVRARGNSGVPTNLALRLADGGAFGVPVVVTDLARLTPFIISPSPQTRWGAGTNPPTDLLLATQSFAALTIDCVVPFYVP